MEAAEMRQNAATPTPRFVCPAYTIAYRILSHHSFGQVVSSFLLLITQSARSIERLKPALTAPFGIATAGPFRQDDGIHLMHPFLTEPPTTFPTAARKPKLAQPT
jgi:hypothetical protein